MPILYLINAEPFFVAPFVHPDEGMIVRYVQPLTQEQRQLLETTMKDDPSFRARSRAHSLLLSAHGTAIKAIAKTYQVHRVTVSAWIKHWEQHGAQSLHDKPRSGRPSTLRPEERDLALQYIKEEPQALKRVGQRFADKTDKHLSLSSLKRLAKKARLRWKRVRKSLKSLRDPDAFAQAKRELEGLQHQEDQGQIALYYFDESGFALDPTIPYAWQEPKRVIELPARKSGRINVLGFMNRQNDLHPFLFEGSIHTGVVIACFDAFCQTLTKKTVVVIDNASIHTSEAFEDRLPYWKKKGLTIKYLPPYAPELNLIAILWRRIKYTWLPFSAYECLNALSEALETILSHVGSEYQITFA
ncbi:MAG TPA: IS630 family transposase [Candidatus Saccharimonadales bacterium]|nr:IS630 family transposase [Candidatus Saccharimonadales bacterium]